MELRTFVNWWMWCLVTDSSCSTWGRRLTVRSRVSSASVSKDWVRETTCTARSCWAHSPRGGLTDSFLLAWGELVARGAQKKPDLVEGITLAPTARLSRPGPRKIWHRVQELAGRARRRLPCRGANRDAGPLPGTAKTPSLGLAPRTPPACWSGPSLTPNAQKAQRPGHAPTPP